MAEFKDRWVEDHTPGLGDNIGRAVRREGPLKPRMDTGVNVVRRQRGALDRMVSKLESRDRALLGKVAAAKGRRDMHTARVLAGELSELRKVKRIMLMAGLSLEKVEIRLSGYVGLGDAVAVIAPTVHLMKRLGASLGRFIPEADTEMNQMAETLNTFMSKTTGGDAFSVDPSSDEDTQRIMQEAAAVAGQAVGSRFPSTPTDAQDIRLSRL